MSKVTTNNFQKGMFIEFKNEPHQIVEFQHVNPGKGSAFVRTKLKGLKSGKVQEFTFKSGESAEEIPIYTKELQYLYKDSTGFVFMDQKSYEQMSITLDIIGTFGKFVKEGKIYQILVLDGKAVGMRLPKKVRLLVTEAEDAVRGNTMMGAKKTVTLETGVQIQAPLFIKRGDVVAVDPESGTYLERESLQ